VCFCTKLNSVKIFDMLIENYQRNESKNHGAGSIASQKCINPGENNRTCYRNNAYIVKTKAEEDFNSQKKQENLRIVGKNHSSKTSKTFAAMKLHKKRKYMSDYAGGTAENMCIAQTWKKCSCYSRSNSSLGNIENRCDKSGFFSDSYNYI